MLQSKMRIGVTFGEMYSYAYGHNSEIMRQLEERRE